ncbi:hypothetical protein LOTGIDRAFT_168398 [Lottia gigantea]|uniref:Indoleamine 2,3-dioxygenase n=1 Tax=Lottia gigantea TaxID=225164 RepID=V4B7V5_LOTGI|nr:hypothetical protein LOTGIDRAFT_168398 [Lottia gigantea]ESO84734.1 hypothetical protein LOTGIDRAFT_168398 [Lottia gigantea]
MLSLKANDIKLEDYDISFKTGFLLENPLETLPEYFDIWNQLSNSLPELIDAGLVRERVLQMPELDANRLTSHRELRLAHIQLSFIGAGYIWQDRGAVIPELIPKCLAVPWYNVSKRLGIYPIISYPTLYLANYKLIDQSSNITTIGKLPGGEHYEWFVRVNNGIEIAFIKCLKPILDILHNVENREIGLIVENLQIISDCMLELKSLLSRIHEQLSAVEFYNVLRPFLTGWGGESSPMPDGLIYEGIENNKPLKVMGGSGAQSAIFQILDAVLGIKHSADKQKYLLEIRKYILPKHRQFIFDIESLPYQVKTLVCDCGDEELKKEYNKCVESIKLWRSYHIQIITKYIVIPSKKVTNKNTSLSSMGTGGTSPMPFLKDLRQDTTDAILS